jgi:hypothetical protein
MRSVPDLAWSWKEFDRRVAETARWCTARARPGEPRQGLWTVDIAPPPLETNRFHACRTVAERREAEGRAYPEADPAGGRLLAYFPDADLTDGAAEVQSGGFFDGFNTPPWDTWVGFVEDDQGDIGYRGYIVAWVPRSLFPFVEEGIDVNPEQCIRWLDDTDTALAVWLRERAGVETPVAERPNPRESRPADPPARGWRLPFFRSGRKR